MKTPTIETIIAALEKADGIGSNKEAIDVVRKLVAPKPGRCPFCGAVAHGEETRPSVTCTRHLWSERALLRDALRHVANQYDGATCFINFMDKLDWKQIRFALEQTETN